MSQGDSSQRSSINFVDNEAQISPKFPTNTTTDNTSKNNYSSVLDDKSIQENCPPFFYSDLSVVHNNGYIPAAGMGIANQEFQRYNQYSGS